MRQVLVGDVAAVPPGEGRTFDVAGLKIAVFHARSGKIYATQAACPHKGGPLADGLVGGETVICPLHDRIFDLHTGAGPEADCALTIYPVSIGDDGKIWLQLTPSP